MLVRIDELIVGTPGDDSSVDFAVDRTSRDRDGHSDSVRIGSAVDCLSDFGPDVEDMGQCGSLGKHREEGEVKDRKNVFFHDY